MSWRWSKAKITSAPHDVIVGRSRNGISLYKKQRPSIGDLPTRKPKTLFYRPEYSSGNGTAEVKQIFGEKVYDNPKPLRLLKAFITLAANHDDIILDSFAGSGTTAHAVLELNKEDCGSRRFILVECEDYADTITAERVRRVIKGVPNAKNEALREGIDGSFTYCTLGDPLGIEGMLTGEALPDFGTLAAYLLNTASGISAGSRSLAAQDEEGLFYSSDALDYYLLYRPEIDYLSSDAAVLNEVRARRISARGKKALVFGPGKYITQRDLTPMDITFYQLPYQMHRTE